MKNYTENLTIIAKNLYEYDALDKLPGIIASFRGHGEALSHFLDAHGYNGEDTPSSKAIFLKRKFTESGVGRKKARNALTWLTSTKGFDRESGFRIAFALDLDIEETGKFFRSVMLDRSFDCHIIKEAIYYFCIYHHRKYAAAEEMIKSIPDPDRFYVSQAGEVLYAKNVISFIQSCPDEILFINYIKDNLGQFGYNQEKAKLFIQNLWNRISAPNGLAAMERYYFPVTVNLPSDFPNSIWDVYLQILGLDSDDVKNIHTDRTIAPILANHTFIHQFTSENFPNRQSIEKLLRGITTPYDLTRKVLILLIFYHFWMNRALSHSGQKSYQADENDAERFLAETDQFLLEAGFAKLYAGNPYDWIFLWAARREAPLIAFRNYWQLLSAEYNEVHS